MWEKNCHMWCWNCIMWGWNRQMWEKSKGTTKCEKRIVTCDVRTALCENGTIKCEKKVTWCSRLPTSGYRTSPLLEEYIRITLFKNQTSFKLSMFYFPFKFELNLKKANPLALMTQIILEKIQTLIKNFLNRNVNLNLNLRPSFQFTAHP